MTDLERAVLKRSEFIERYRPMLLALEAGLFTAGAFFLISGALDLHAFRAETWGARAYAIPAWVWGAANATSAAVVFYGLLRPVKNALVAVGSGMHLMQFSMLVQSIFAPDGCGDAGVGIFAALFVALHAVLVFEGVRWSR